MGIPADAAGDVFGTPYELLDRGVVLWGLRHHFSLGGADAAL